MVVDPPWMPHFKAKMEEVTINQEESVSLVIVLTSVTQSLKRDILRKF